MRLVDRLSSVPQILASLVALVGKECAKAMVTQQMMMTKVSTAVIAAEQEAAIPVEHTEPVVAAAVLASSVAAAMVATVLAAVAAAVVVATVVAAVAVVASVRASTLVEEHNKGPEILKCYLPGFKTYLLRGL